METIRSPPLCTEIVLNVPQNENRTSLRVQKDLLAALLAKREGRALKALLVRGAASQDSNYFCGGHDWTSLQELLLQERFDVVDETIRTGVVHHTLAPKAFVSRF